MAEKIWPNKEKPSVKTEGFSHFDLVTNRLRRGVNHSHSIMNKKLINQYINKIKNLKTMISTMYSKFRKPN